MHVATGAEGDVASTGQDDDGDVGGFTAMTQGVADFGDGLRGEGVAIAGTVDSYLGNAFVFLKKDFFVLFDCFPVAFHFFDRCFSINVVCFGEGGVHPPFLCLYVLVIVRLLSRIFPKGRDAPPLASGDG